MMSVDDADVRAHRAELAQLLLVLEHGVAALHGGENAIGAALHRQMQEIIELRNVRIGLDQAVVEFERMRGGEANALDAATAATKWISVARSASVPSAMSPA